MSSQRLNSNAIPHRIIISFVSNCFAGSSSTFFRPMLSFHPALGFSFLSPSPLKRIPWSQPPALRRIVAGRGFSVLLAHVPSFIQGPFAHRSPFVASHRSPMSAHGFLCLRQPKGLRDRNSPICTLSQNGYGAVHITRTGCRWLPLTFFLISLWR